MVGMYNLTNKVLANWLPIGKAELYQQEYNWIRNVLWDSKFIKSKYNLKIQFAEILSVNNQSSFIQCSIRFCIN